MSATMTRTLALFALTWLVACHYDTAGVSFADGDAGFAHPDASERGADASTDATTPTGPDAAPPDARPPLACPDGYQADPTTGSSYRLSPAGIFLDWSFAEGACADDGKGTHLVVIDDDAELGRVAALTGGNAAWIGISDRVTEDQFLRVTGGEATFLPWQSHQPDNSGLFGEDCVELTGGKLNDQGCSTLERYVCECDGRNPDPAAF
jgi:hypothetical protein